MSAETLRKAAEAIRDEDPGCNTHGCPWHGPVALAVADWLDYWAGLADKYEFPEDTADLLRPALVVAHAYLGEVS